MKRACTLYRSLDALRLASARVLARECKRELERASRMSERRMKWVRSKATTERHLRGFLNDFTVLTVARKKMD